jgi:hypothetical protein
MENADMSDACSIARPRGRRRRGPGRLIGSLAGCVADSSNPVVTASSATLHADRAEMVLRIEHPGGRDLVITAVEYELSHGDLALPVAEGRWQGEADLPAGGEASIPLHIAFDVEPLEPDSRRLHLNGSLHLEDRTGFLGLGFMDLTDTAFQVEVEADTGVSE